MPRAPAPRRDETMKTWHLPILLLALTAPVSTVGQTAPPPPPPPSADYSPSQWTPYTSAAGRFRARFPGPPTERESTLTTPRGPVTMHTVVFRSFILYSVTYADFPHDIEGASELQDAFSAMRASTLAAVEDQAPRVV